MKLRWLDEELDKMADFLAAAAAVSPAWAALILLNIGLTVFLAVVGAGIAILTPLLR